MIICLGATPTVQRSMIFPRVMANSVNRARRVVEGASGKSVNVARVLRVLGEPALATGFVGGTRGRFLIGELDRAGVVHEFVHVQAQTRLCITVMEEQTRNHTELVEEAGAVTATDCQSLLEKLRELLDESQLLALSGSLPPGAPPDFYRRCIDMASGAGVKSVLDAAGQPLAEALPARPMLIKPNRQELSATLGRKLETDEELLEGMRQMIGRGIESIVVTMGSQGAVAMRGEQAWRIAIPKVEAINSIGSGDSFTAGLCAILARGGEFTEALRLGAACAVANALTLISGEVHRADVDRLLPQIAIQPW